MAADKFRFALVFLRERVSEIKELSVLLPNDWDIRAAQHVLVLMPELVPIVRDSEKTSTDAEKRETVIAIAEGLFRKYVGKSVEIGKLLVDNISMGDMKIIWDNLNQTVRLFLYSLVGAMCKGQPMKKVTDEQKMECLKEVMDYLRVPGNELTNESVARVILSFLNKIKK